MMAATVKQLLRGKREIRPFFRLTGMVFVMASAALQPAMVHAQQQGGAGAQTGARPGVTSNGGWVVNCTSRTQDEGLVCQMSQEVVIRETGQKLLGVVLRKGSQHQGLTMLLAMPHGLFFPAGVRLRIDDGKPVRVDMQTSDPRGSYAAFNVDEAFLAAMRNGNRMTVSTVDVQKKELAVEVTLAGFTAAVSKLSEAK